MYEFVDTDQEQEVNNRLPSEALFINGQDIESAIEGYRTLTVSGRELMSTELNTVRRTNSDGAIYLDKSYPPRIITVQYELKAKDNEDFRYQYEELNYILSQEQAELKFNDDLDYSFYGTLSEVSEVPEGTNTVIGTFSFYCSDPLKYQRELTANGNAPSIIFNERHDMLPSKIVAVVSGATSTITLKNGSKQVRLTQGSFKAGQRVTFDFYEQEIFTGSVNYKDKLDLASEFEHFYLRSGVPVTMTEAGTLELSYRLVSL